MQPRHNHQVMGYEARKARQHSQERDHFIASALAVTIALALVGLIMFATVGSYFAVTGGAN